MFEVGFSELVLIFGLALIVLRSTAPAQARSSTDRTLGRAGTRNGAAIP